MSQAARTVTPSPPAAELPTDLHRYEHGPFKFGDPDLYDRHLMFEDVYKHMPPHLARQREELRALRAIQPKNGSPGRQNLDEQAQSVAKEG